jgi:hypothetical protein
MNVLFLGLGIADTLTPTSHTETFKLVELFETVLISGRCRNEAL